MKKKTNIIIILSILLIIIMSGTYAYSRYASAAIAEGTMNTAAWDILVNECNIVTPDPDDTDCFATKTIPEDPSEDEEQIVVLTRNFKITDEYLSYEQQQDVVATGKIAPGTTANIKIKIDSNNTKVAYRYTLTSNFTIENDFIKVYISNDGADDPTEQTFIPNQQYKAQVFANELALGNIVHEINIRVVWENDETGGNDEIDTALGTNPNNESIEFPIEIHFEQIVN